MSKFKSQYKKDTDLSLVNLKLHNIGHEACDPLHTWTGLRDFYSFHTVVEGCGTYKVDDKLYHLKAGDTFLIYPNTLVTYSADAEHPWEYLWLGISGIYVKNIIDYTEFSPEHPCIYEKNEIDLKSRLLDIYKAQGNGMENELEMIGLTYVFLSKLLAEDKKYPTDRSDHYGKKAKEFIELNYSNGITPQEVAQKLNISRSHLHRIFTGNYGFSVGKYIKKLQLDRAVFLLKTTNLSIGEISNSVGFENQLYFSNVFKKSYQLSPNEYRKQLKKH